MSEPTALLDPLKPVTVEARLWRDSRFVQDTWQRLRDDAPIPPSGRIIVTLDRWQKDERTLRERKAPTGLAVPIGADFSSLMRMLPLARLISLPFPRFSDGRSYSTARQARDAGFGGELRATGDILLDQLPLMLRTGFETFEITDAATIHALERRPPPTIALVYQSGCEPSFREWRSRRAGEAPGRNYPITMPPQSTGRS